MLQKKRHHYKSAEKRLAEAKAAKDLAALPTTFPVNDQVAPIVAHHDRLASDCEARWGIGRLPEIVEPELADKFRRQQQRMYQAMYNGSLADQEKTVQAMIRAWEALDKRAKELGRDPVSDKWFEVATHRGLVAVWADIATAEKATRTGRYKLAVHAQALGAVIDAEPKLMRFLADAPHGRVTIRRKTTTGDPGRPFNDQIPF